MYDLSTAKPHTPPKKTYSVSEWAIYSEGYYRALVMALQAMKAAERAAELFAMKDPRPTLITREQSSDASKATTQADEQERPSRWARFAAIAAVIFVLELLALMGAIILRVLQ